MTLKHSVRRLIRRLTGHEIEGLDSGAYAIVPAKRLAEAWYSYRVQLQGILRRFGIDLVIDVGANEGQFAKSLRKFYSGDIVSFEPVSAPFTALQQAAASDPRWTVYNLAIGNENAAQTIHVSQDTVFSSLLASNDYCADRFGPQALGTRDESISVRRLDELLDGLQPRKDRRIFLKMDTQGYDVNVFRGLGDKLPRVLAMQSEVSLIPIYDDMPRWTESLEIYERAGFGVVGLYPVTRDQGCIIEYDCLLQRRMPA